MDDILAVSECGIDTIDLNSAVNVKIESKSLSLGPDKCKKLHISSPRDKRQCYNEENLKVHNENRKNTSKLKYLGDFLNQGGNFNDTITDRVNRAIGLRSQLMSLLSNISLGSFYLKYS